MRIGTLLLVFPDNTEGIGFVSSGIVFFQKHLLKKYGFTDNRIPTHIMYVKEVKENDIIVHSMEEEGAVDISLNNFNVNNIEAYDIQDDITEEQLQRFINDRSQRKKGKPYAILQLIFYMWMWVCENLGFEMRKAKNWFPFNEVCTEDVWQYFMERSDFSPNNIYIKDAVNYLNSIWTENTIRPLEWRYILSELNNVFIRRPIN